MSLENAKVGDMVVITSGMYGECLAIVDKITKTLVIVGNSKFNKDGYSVPKDEWLRNTCRLATQEDKDRLNAQTDCNKLLIKLNSIIPAFKDSYKKYDKEVWEKIKELNILMNKSKTF